MTRREAREWVRNHWVEYITNADAGMSVMPQEVEAVWSDECKRIAARIGPKQKEPKP